MKLFIATLCLAFSVALATDAVAAAAKTRDLVTAADWDVSYDEHSFEYDSYTNKITFKFSHGSAGEIYYDSPKNGKCPNGRVPYGGLDWANPTTPDWINVYHTDSYGITTVTIDVLDTISDHDNFECVKNSADPAGLCSKVKTMFCLRYGLRMGDMLINFRQVKFWLTYQLEGEFSIEFMTIAKGPAHEDVKEEVEIKTTLCNEPGGWGKNPDSYTQGEPICVRVCPKHDDYYAKTLGGAEAATKYEGLDLSQELTDEYGYPIGDLAWVKCGSEIIYSANDADRQVAPPEPGYVPVPVKHCCEITFLLKSFFFPYRKASKYTTVHLKGWAYFSLSDGSPTYTTLENSEEDDNGAAPEVVGRGGGRALQEEGGAAASTFDVEVNLEGSDTSESGASDLLSFTNVAAAAGAAGAALLL